MRRVAAAGAALLVPLLLLSACVRMPTDGPVVQSQGDASADVVTGTYYDPAPPQPGESANEIVLDFLEAMKATPIGTSVAQEYLTEAAQQSWEPEEATITYDDIGEPVGELNLSVPITGVNEYDAHGSWVRQVGNGAADGVPDDMLDFRLTIEDDEWRINELPNALVVPTSWFDDRFRRVSLYFFDPAGEVLVPEPVYVPEGDQFATSLLEGLVAGPVSGPRVTRTFIPDGLEPGLSVPIADGVADVGLLGQAGDSSQLVTEQMLAQLVWTLRQEPRIEALRLSLSGEPLSLPGGQSEVSVTSAGQFDPRGTPVANQLYALRDGLLVAGDVDALEPTSGRFGTERLGLREVAVDLTGTLAAGVSGGGTSVLMTTVAASDASASQVLRQAGDLLRPAWDVGGRLWLVDRGDGAARVLVLVDGEPRSVRVPGVTGRRVSRFLVSRDGTRFVALVRGAEADSVVVARVEHDAQGRVLGVGDVRVLDLGDDQPRRIRDIGWRSLTSIAVLNRITGELAQVRTVSVDGAPGDAEPPGWSRMRGGGQRLVTSPLESDSVLVLSAGGVSDLTDPDRSVDELDPAVTSLGYAG